MNDLELPGNESESLPLAFCNAKYWRRMWTLQDFVLPKTLYVWYGEKGTVPVTLISSLGLSAENYAGRKQWPMANRSRKL